MIDLKDFKTRQESKCRRITYKHYCDNCNKDLGYKRKNLSRSGLGLCCFGTIRHAGKSVSMETREKMRANNHIRNGGIHPRLGKPHSEATKILLSQKQIDFCKNSGNQFLGQKHSQETIGKLSKTNSGKEPQWKGRVFQYDGPKGFFKMRSSYELFYANWMDQQAIEWIYEPQYKLNNGKTFSPDFQLSTGDIIEIKGYWAKVGLEKWNMFCNSYPNLSKRVLMKEDLKKLGLI